MIYMNEILTIEPTKFDAYVLQFINEYVPIMAKHDIQLLGLWQTWRTNELWAFWEVRELSSLDKLDKAVKEDRALVEYTRRSLPSRLHWRTKILLPTKFCPDIERVKREGIKGEVYILCIIPIVPEKIDEYLDLFPRYGMRFEERHGLRTVGYWIRGGGEPYQSEVFFCTQLCAWKDWASTAHYREACETDPELKEWRQRALYYRTHHTLTYLIPLYLPY